MRKYKSPYYAVLAHQRVESRTRRLRVFLSRHTATLLVITVCLAVYLPFLYLLATTP